jgi:hypothetical protein
MSSLVKAVLYGAASAALYVLLYLYADRTVELARRVQQGEHIWFLAPIVIAFVFSYVHGMFTAYFWDAIGLNPASRKRRK